MLINLSFSRSIPPSSLPCIPCTSLLVCPVGGITVSLEDVLRTKLGYFLPRDFFLTASSLGRAVSFCSWSSLWAAWSLGIAPWVKLFFPCSFSGWWWLPLFLVSGAHAHCLLFSTVHTFIQDSSQEPSGISSISWWMDNLFSMYSYGVFLISLRTLIRICVCKFPFDP